MWSRTLAWIIICIFVFGFLMTWIPDSFAPDTSVQDVETLTAINAADLIVYQSAGSDNMTFSYSSLEDAPNPPQWNFSSAEDEYLEIWWADSGYNIQARHVYTTWIGYSMRDALTWYYVSGEVANPSSPKLLQGAHLAVAWNTETNSSAFTASCAHITISIVFMPDEGYTDVEEAFNDGVLWYAISYKWNADDTGFSVMSLLVKLLTFEGVGVGVPGELGSFIDILISTLFYIAIAVVAYVVITAIIPFVPGVKG